MREPQILEEGGEDGAGELINRLAHIQVAAIATVAAIAAIAVVAAIAASAGCGHGGRCSC